MLALRQRLRVKLLASTMLLAMVMMPSALRAEGRLAARYEATLAGITIGTGTWVIDIDTGHYSAVANGKTSGLLRVISGGQGTGSARGVLFDGRPVSSAYTAIIESRKETDQVRLKIHGGNVTELTVVPPQDHSPKRVPIQEGHRRGVLDPMTASILPVPGNVDLLSPNACQRHLPVFDGRLRYDLQLAFKRMDTVKAEKGYAGPVVVCAVYFSPIAGYIPSRTAIKYLAKLHDMEIWLAPIAGTHILVPFRAQAPTPLGRAVFEATEFVSMTTPKRASLDGALAR